MNIIYFIHDLHTIGGIERVTVNKANWLVQQGHTVSIVTTDQNSKKLAFNLSGKVKLIDLGLNYKSSRGKNWFCKAIKLIKNHYCHRIKLEKVLHDLSPDIVISTFGPEMGILADMQLKCPKILEFHSAIVQFHQMKNAKGIRGIINRINYNSVYKNISKFDRFVILSEHELNVWALHNAIAIPNACYMNVNISYNSNSKTVIAVGRLSKEKDFSTLLDVWKIVQSDIDGWNLKIYGDGPEHSSLAYKIESLNLSGSVELMGTCHDMEKEYASASVFCMTSHYEGQPMVLIEALTCGVPSVVFETDGRMKKLSNNGTLCFVIQPRDKNGMALRLIELMNNRDLRIEMSKRARNISDIFNQYVIMHQWEHLFKTLVAEQ